MVQRRMDHLRSHFTALVVWDGEFPVSSDTADYQRASKEAREHTDYARSRKYKRHSIPAFRIVCSTPTLLDKMLSGAGPSSKQASDEGRGGEALSLDSGPPSPLSLAPDTEEVSLTSPDRELDLSPAPATECPDNSLNSSSTIEFGEGQIDIDEESNEVPPPPPELDHGHEHESQVSYKKS